MYRAGFTPGLKGRGGRIGDRGGVRGHGSVQGYRSARDNEGGRGGGRDKSTMRGGRDGDKRGGRSGVRGHGSVQSHRSARDNEGGRGGGKDKSTIPGRREGNQRGFKMEKAVIIKSHHSGVYTTNVKGNKTLFTVNFAPGSNVYGEKIINVDSTDGNKIEYRVWNPFKSKLAAAILCGITNILIKPGSKILYLGAASGTSVSHVSDIVGSEGIVYAVEFSHRSGRGLISLAQKRKNIIPIIEDAQHPLKYRMLLGMVDTIFADVAQPNQAQIVASNANFFLKNGGNFVISIKADCIDSTAQPEKVFDAEVKKLNAHFKKKEQIRLDRYKKNHAVVTGSFRAKNC